MRLPLIYKIITPFILVVFTITSCNVFSMPEPGKVPVEDMIGKGDARFVYLDENHNPTTNDIGKMAMYVENNELTKDVFVLAEIRNNNIDNDVVVRVINKQNNSLVSFFYYKDQSFPHKTVITIDGEDVIGRFSLYNTASETYSVEFTCEDGESENVQNLVLNKNVFLQQKDDAALTDTQNVRLHHIITTLALWNSLALQIDDNFQAGSRGIKLPKISSIITGALVVVALVAIVAVIYLAPVGAVAIVGATLTVSTVTTGQVVAAGIAIAAIAGAVITHIMADEIDKYFDNQDSNQASPPPNVDSRPKVKITSDGVTVKNNGMMYYLKYDHNEDKGESLTFNLKITDRIERFPNDSKFKETLISWFDPNLKGFISDIYNNAQHLNVSIDGDISDVLYIEVSRNNIEGYNRDGRVQIVLQFGMNVIINDDGSGIDFWSNLNEPEKIRRGDIFVLNFTVLEP